MRKLAARRALIAPLDKLTASYEDIAELKGLLENTSDAETEADLSRMVEKFFRELDDLEITTLLSGEHDAANAILGVNAGAGGTEACDWAQMLSRMYTRWAESHSYKLEVLSETPGDVVGYRSATMLISGLFAYGRLKSEHGVHRLVRISPFDASNKRHTTFAMVDLMPEVAEAEMQIEPADLRVETFRSSGAGGQHVNKTESAVRLTHIPTGIVVTCQNERSQHKNRATAMRILTSRIAESERVKSEERMRQLKGVLTSADWGHQIRSYVMQPYTLVKDLRTKYQTANVQAVLDGELDGFIEAGLRNPSR